MHRPITNTDFRQTHQRTNRLAVDTLNFAIDLFDRPPGSGFSPGSQFDRRASRLRQADIRRQIYTS